MIRSIQNTCAANGDESTSSDVNINCKSCELIFKPKNFWNLLCPTCSLVDNPDPKDPHDLSINTVDATEDNIASKSLPDDLNNALVSAMSEFDEDGTNTDDASQGV